MSPEGPVMPEIPVPSQETQEEKDSLDSREDRATQETAPSSTVEHYDSLETSEEKTLSVGSGEFADRLEGLSGEEAEKVIGEWEQWTIGLMQTASDRERLGFRIDLNRARMYMVQGRIADAKNLVEGILIEANDIPGLVDRAPDLIDRAYNALDYIKSQQ